MKKFLLCILFCFLCLGRAYCDTLSLNLDAAKKLALTNNRDILTVKESINSSKGKIIEATSAYLPKLNLIGNYSYIDPVPISSTTVDIPLPFPLSPISKTMEVKAGASDNTLYKASLTQLIFDWGRTFENIGIANAGRDIGEFNLSAMENQIIFAVTQYYYNALLAKKIFDLNAESLKIAEERLKNVEQNYKNGAISSFELLKTKVQVSNLRPQVSKAQSNMEMAKNYLKNILAIPLDSQIEISQEIKEETFIAPDYESSVSKALRSRPELKRANSQKYMAQQALGVAHSVDKPVLTASANYQYQYPYYSQIEWVSNWNAGVNLTIPIFDGFYAYSKVKQAKADLQSTEISLKNTENAIELDVKQALLNLDDAKARTISQKDALSQAEEYYRIADSSLKSGVITNVDVLDAQVSLLSARTAYTQALYDYIIAKAMYQKAVGEIK